MPTKEKGGNNPQQYCPFLNTEEPLNEANSLKKIIFLSLRAMGGVQNFTVQDTNELLRDVMNDDHFRTIHSFCCQAVLGGL